MRSIKILTFVLTTAACVAAQYQSVRIPNDSKFTADAVFEESKGGDALFSTGTKNGVRYRISHLDATGSVEGLKGGELAVGFPRPSIGAWQLICHRYPAAESRQCGIVRNGITFIMNVGRAGSIPWLTATNAQLGFSSPSSR